MTAKSCIPLTLMRLAKEDPLSIVMENSMDAKFPRPWLGVKLANLHTANLEILEQFLLKFPTFYSGVIVPKLNKISSILQ
ncbi:hypothetical protein OROHE_002411 [Orobanche hederae]